MVKDLDTLRGLMIENAGTQDVDVGEPFGVIRVKALSARVTLQLLDIWKTAGLVKVTRSPDGGHNVEVAVTEESLDVDAALNAFVETVIASAIDDQGELLFRGEEGREVANELPMDVLGKLANAAMKLGETPSGK